jgi:hypothetical protein
VSRCVDHLQLAVAGGNPLAVVKRSKRYGMTMIAVGPWILRELRVRPARDHRINTRDMIAMTMSHDNVTRTIGALLRDGIEVRRRSDSGVYE